MDSVNTEPTEQEDLREWYDAYVAELRTYEKVRVALMRRALADANLDISAKILLCILIDKVDPHTDTAQVALKDFTCWTGIAPDRIVTGLQQLKRGAYVKCAPGSRTTYTILPLRVITGGPAA